jgi:hypothetical protein
MSYPEIAPSYVIVGFPDGHHHLLTPAHWPPHGGPFDMRSEHHSHPHTRSQTQIEALQFLLKAVSIKVAATAMTNKDAGRKIIEQVDVGVRQFLDDDGGGHFGWPPAPPHSSFSDLASDLISAANSSQSEGVRNALITLAGAVLDKNASR